MTKSEKCHAWANVWQQARLAYTPLDILAGGKALWLYRRIFVYVFCLINIYAHHYLMKLIKQNLWILKEHDDFSYLWKFEPDIYIRNGFGEITTSFLKTRNFAKNVWLIDFFATQFLMADIFFNIARKELKNVQIAQVNQLFQGLNLLCTYGQSLCELSRMLMRKNVNNDVSKDSPISYMF